MIQKYFYLVALMGISMSSAAQETRAPKTDASMVSAPTPEAGMVLGTVTDTDGASIPGAAVVLQGPTSEDKLSISSDANGYFVLPGVRPSVEYQVTVSEDGFGAWTSTVHVLPGQHLELKDMALKVSAVVTSVTAASSEEIATEQEHSEEQQRAFGIVPNFYVSYAPDPQPLTTALKFRLALRASTDVVTFASTAMIAGMNQAAHTPSYVEGAKGYGQRFGAAYAGAAVDVMVGGAILPSLLHQDPRYFYKGTGTKKQRALHAIAAPFIARGDNGKQQFNFSSIGGDLATGALENVYYPPMDRGPHLVLDGALIDTGGRIVNALAQEFLLKRVTSRGAE